jgi:hypothetical protein
MLYAVHEIASKGGLARDNGHWMEMFCDKLGFKGLNRHETGGLFASMARKGYVLRVLRGSKAVGYQLSDQGLGLIQELLASDSAKAAAPPAAPPAPPRDRAQLLIDLANFGEQAARAKTELNRVVERERALVAELDQLRDEKEKLCSFLDDQSVQDTIAQLLTQLRKP